MPSLVLQVRPRLSDNPKLRTAPSLEAVAYNHLVVHPLSRGQLPCSLTERYLLIVSVKSS
jgi:hypothetical protein